MADSGASSPGSSPVELRHCVDELLRFTLQSHVAGTLNLAFDLGLSVEFCSALLRDDPCGHSPVSPSPSSGVPAYPLYKRLASALEEALSSGVSFPRHESLAWFNQEDDIHNKKVLDQLISSKGAELLNILKSIKFELHVQEPYFTQLKDGLKTIEGRCAHGNYKRIVSGDLILFNKCLVLEVQDVHWYASFFEMLGAECLSEVLPGVNSVAEGVQFYRKFYTEEKEKSNGVLAIGVSRSIDQPYISLARIISGLTSKGVQKLLGLVHTAGTVPESLPPPRSALLSAFQLPYNPNVKGSTLTDGARALAKHVNRSSDKYWGNFKGSGENLGLLLVLYCCLIDLFHSSYNDIFLANSDSCKNELAKDVISRLVATCQWQNLHAGPPHGVVFEIRDVSGYGARWSEDGLKFIGFLEPYVKDGHVKGWKH
ncbi:uncharacterized protein LOC115745270 isoform X2 [Rhodamnia argentea]|uniref:Uncharacterized protein LOC115745270 isoform X2 n=1 Tax=Rhodamnia argentea TaxID=178133 RepID=A0ABM3HQ59_9MYRT|nr:uncharacterized protein LOC115745270 isoform X2 [Rhodamnia argentea]